ncbi:putative N-terminal amidase [Triangularia setosa]|uniref:N-terminal amidase n=1 Tax=Triangularia setosa TaxID=2587417 RepID=A0AAN6WC84_9PEZI|nr:putative N-terminal amidase [Podospora setosa]
MRIACLQFSPQVGEVTKNISKADALLAASAADLEEGIDLLVLPEMSFSGYNFRSQSHIIPFLESPSSGPTSSWAKQKAQSLNCTVAVGYPELQSHTDKEYYNSLLVINPSGHQIANYRKSFLYYTDATWAKEGPGFYSDSSDSQVLPGKSTAMGICMDINPYNFTNPWNLYEFARHCLTVRANLVVISMAWLTLDMRERFLTGKEQQPDLETLAYWAGRLEPLIRQGGGHEEEEEDEIIIVFANRCGWEDEAVYAGSSAVMGVKKGEVSVYGVLGRGVEEVLVVDTDGEPFGRLVTRSKQDSEDGEEELSPPQKQQENFHGDEKPTSRTVQPPNSSSNTNSPPQPPPSCSRPAQPQHRTTQFQRRPKLTLLTDPSTIPPFRSSPPSIPPLHLSKNLSISITPRTFYNSLPTTPPHPHSSTTLWSISPDNDTNPFSDKHAADITAITSFPVSFSSSFSPSFFSEPLSPRSLSSLEDEMDDAERYFEAWLVSPMGKEDDDGNGRRGPGKKPRLGYLEEERLRGWKWPATYASEVDEVDEDVSPMTTNKDDEREEEMIRIMASPSVFADLKPPQGNNLWGAGRRMGS